MFTGGSKRGRDTKVSLPLLTPQPFLRTRLPSVARLNARGPQGRSVPQGTPLDRSRAFRSDGVRALHRMAAHCYARRITQADLRALQRPKSCPTHGTELPFLSLRRATEGSRGLKERLGELRGGKETIGVLSPFCPRRRAAAFSAGGHRQSLRRGHGVPRPPKAANAHALQGRKVACGGKPPERRNRFPSAEGKEGNCFSLYPLI